MHTIITNSQLKIYTLGQFKLVLRDKSTYHISKKQLKLWKLFKFLLIYHNKGIAPEIILESISPDIEYNNPQNAIQNMVYRLRKLLADDSLFGNNQQSILYSNGCYKINNQNIWIDFIELEILLDRAELLKKENPPDAIEPYQNALELYSGELYPELIYDDWVIPKRAYYRKLYLTIIMALAKLYADQQSYDSIIQICQKAITLEPYEEEIHILLIENLLKIGKIRDAKHHYEETVRIFEKEFGIKPTPEMQKIAQLLNSEYRPIIITNKKPPQNSLLNEEKIKGIFHCDYSVFYAIYVLEKRRAERTGNAVCPVYIRFDNGKNVYKSNALKNSAVNDFQNLLYKSLRKGDMMTVIDKTTFLILLYNTEYPLVKFVLNRIIQEFNENEAYRDIILEIEACSSLSKLIR